MNYGAALFILALNGYDDADWLKLKAFENRPCVTVAVSGRSTQVKAELSSTWQPRHAGDELYCIRMLKLQARIKKTVDIRVIDIYHPEHPGYPAVRWEKHKWERMTVDWWLHTGAPLIWMDWWVRQQTSEAGVDHSDVGWWNDGRTPDRYDSLPAPWDEHDEHYRPFFGTMPPPLLPTAVVP